MGWISAQAEASRPRKGVSNSLIFLGSITKIIEPKNRAYFTRVKSVIKDNIVGEKILVAVRSYGIPSHC